MNKSELQIIHERLVAERRRRVGPPPTDDELLAYVDGTLSAEDAARIRESLIAYPELARAIATPFPADDAHPGDTDYVSDEEIGRRWAELQTRLGHDPIPMQPPINTWRRASMALAAMLLVAVAGMIWQTVSLKQARSAPHVASDEQLLVPDGQRGASEVHATLTARGDWFFLLAPMINPPDFPAYRIDIIDIGSSTPRRLWSSPALRRPANDTFAIAVPRGFFKPGEYQVIAYGVNRSRQERLMSYSLHVAAGE